MRSNFQPSLDFVWQPGFDNPADGYHITPGDPGGGTLGGVIQANWDRAVDRALVTGSLVGATRADLTIVLRWLCWDPMCDDLPNGIDFLMFNGRMMSGEFIRIFQQSLGFMGDGVDGVIGPETMKLVAYADAQTFINAVCGAHYAYLTRLPTWGEFGRGWTNRLKRAQFTALLMARQAPMA